MKYLSYPYCIVIAAVMFSIPVQVEREYWRILGVVWFHSDQGDKLGCGRRQLVS